ncbi:MAG TPA: helix-turn-helix transcriptional regulator [Jatrophihabitantaceae bacterium]|jgi:DNA-binding PadR family transcriptional regulator|nr:helix-turn-helix transcriptional regulator [Jatrophihabitantaceae bacterium]
MKVDRVKGHLDLVLLSIIDQEPGHGYAVITALRERTNGNLALTEGAVYPALHRLEDLGLLISEWMPVAGRRRRIYRTTPTGRSALRAEMRDWQALVAAVDSVVRPRTSLAASS